MKKKLILFISLFLLLFASVPSVYADSTKKFWTGGYWLGCFDVYMEIDFYLYRIANENFTIKLSNLDKGEFSMWKIENHKLYLWIPPNVNKFEYVCDLPV